MNEHDIELVERFLEGKLDDKELAEFQEKKKQDPEFARFVKVHKMIGDAWISAAHYQKSKRWVNETISDHLKRSPVRIRRNMYFSLAALVLALLSIFIIMKFSSRNTDDIPVIASDTTTTQVELEMNVPPEHKASLDTLYAEPILISPVSDTVFSQNDSLPFTWQPSGTLFRILYIKLIENDSIVLTHELESGQGKLVLPPGKFGSGSYIWYLDIPVVKSHFKIVEE